MGFNYLSAGGAQDPSASGWISGGYTVRPCQPYFLGHPIESPFPIGTSQGCHL